MYYVIYEECLCLYSTGVGLTVWKCDMLRWGLHCCLRHQQQGRNKDGINHFLIHRLPSPHPSHHWGAPSPLPGQELELSGEISIKVAMFSFLTGRWGSRAVLTYESVEEPGWTERAPGRLLQPWVAATHHYRTACTANYYTVTVPSHYNTGQGRKVRQQ